MGLKHWAIQTWPSLSRRFQSDEMSAINLAWEDAHFQVLKNISSTENLTLQHLNIYFKLQLSSWKNGTEIGLLSGTWLAIWAPDTLNLVESPIWSFILDVASLLCKWCLSTFALRRSVVSRVFRDFHYWNSVLWL